MMLDYMPIYAKGFTVLSFQNIGSSFEVGYS